MIDPVRLKSWRGGRMVRTYDSHDARLYALGLGLGGDPMDRWQLRFVGGPEAEILPTMATVLGFDDGWVAGGGVDPVRILHGEQRLWVDRPLPRRGEVAVTSAVADVYDLGAGGHAMVVQTGRIEDPGDGGTLARLESRVVCVGQGGFGGSAGRPEPLKPVPDRPSDLRVTRITAAQQALLYCLSGDDNPMHRDPAVARAAGFARPILHGLCTFGVAGVAVLEATGCAPERLASLSARFTAPVYPGETLRTDLWREDGRWAFRTVCVERGQCALDRGSATFRNAD